MIKILTPPLPLPYKGGEQLPPCLTQGFREALPSLQGERQGLREALPSLQGERQGLREALPSLQGERLRVGERSSGMGQGWGL